MSSTLYSGVRRFNNLRWGKNISQLISSFCGFSKNSKTRTKSFLHMRKGWSDLQMAKHVWTRRRNSWLNRDGNFEIAWISVISSRLSPINVQRSHYFQRIFSLKAAREKKGWITNSIKNLCAASCEFLVTHSPQEASILIFSFFPFWSVKNPLIKVLISLRIISCFKALWYALVKAT